MKDKGGYLIPGWIVWLVFIILLFINGIIALIWILVMLPYKKIFPKKENK